MQRMNLFSEESCRRETHRQEGESQVGDTEFLQRICESGRLRRQKLYESVSMGGTGKFCLNTKKNSAAKGEIVRSFFRCDRKSVSDPYPQGKQERG